MDYKGLNIDRARISEYVNEYIRKDDLTLVKFNDLNGGKAKRVVLRKDGEKDCTVDLLFTVKGTTTIHYLQGQNRDLGENFAQYLYEAIDSNELENVSLSLRNMKADDVDVVMATLEDSVDDDGTVEFEVGNTDTESQKCFKVTSVRYQDSLTITHYKTTECLLIQGKPLYCYKKVIYLLAELLDLAGIQSVIFKKDDGLSSVASINTAKDHLKGKLGGSYDDLPDIIRDLLVSGCCIKLSSPTLPEYSMLLFPDLRALEGTIRSVLGDCGLYPSQETYGIGTFFGGGSLREEYQDQIIGGITMIESLESGYTFLKSHRNELFHMDDFVEASRKIDTLEKALALSDDAYVLIKKLFEAR